MTPGHITNAETKEDGKTIAFVSQDGTFHCSCGGTHRRGALNGYDVFRCLRCGKAFRVRGVAALRKDGE